MVMKFLFLKYNLRLRSFVYHENDQFYVQNDTSRNAPNGRGFSVFCTGCLVVPRDRHGQEVRVFCVLKH